MRPRTELLLYQLLWVGESAMQPTLGSLSGGFEGWAYRSGLIRTIQRLEAMQVLETEGKSLDRVVRLTKKGKRLLIGERDPQECWHKAWDRKWRMVLFDIPEQERKLRDKLRRELRRKGFGCLQKSVWISPTPMDDLVRLLKSARSGLASFTLMESELLPGQKDAQVVDIAWDFNSINAAYQQYMDALTSWTRSAEPLTLEEIVKEEMELWSEAMRLDPLLPIQLLPHGYLGRKAFDKRQKIVPKLIAKRFHRDIQTHDREFECRDGK